MFLGDLDPEAVGPNIAFATHYEPTPMRDALRLIDAVPLAPEGTTFVDLGAGMGRVVLLAAQRGYRSVVGVEISPALAQVARENIAAHDPPLTKGRVRITRADASTFRLPRGDLVIYLFNPFREEVLAPVIDRIRMGDARREVILLYHTPVERAVIDDSGAFDLEADLGFGLVYRLTRPRPTA